MLQRTLSLAFPLGASILLAQEAAPPPASQKPLPTFPGQVEQVTVDVVVTDKKGVPVTGLAKEDLQIFEDGVPQTVVSFEAVEVPPAPSAMPRPRPGSPRTRRRTNAGAGPSWSSSTTSTSRPPRPAGPRPRWPSSSTAASARATA